MKQWKRAVYARVYHAPLGRLERMDFAISSIESLRWAPFAKSMAVNPKLFFSWASAPASRSSFTAEGPPYIAAIIKGVLPLGEAASMYA